MIQVTEPFLPPLEKYKDYIDQIWSRNWITNDGPLIKEFEKKIKSTLGIEYFSFVSNGTSAIQLSIKALDVKGDVITTPFSYVATTSALVWENCNPVFVDISLDTWNIDVNKIEESITPSTTAILATHVFGIPCEIEKIKKIAKKHQLKVIYDAAHCFGVKFQGKSIFSYGDLSITSFHATKLLHTVEGGGVFSNKKELDKKIKLARNFGHNGPEVFEGVGINAKNSEMHAAMGLVNLEFYQDILDHKKSVFETYYSLLNNFVVFQDNNNKNIEPNYSYVPIVFESTEKCLRVQQTLLKNGIGSRRYFYPLLSQLDYVENVNVENAESISSRILCLPTFHSLTLDQVKSISKIILSKL